MERLKRLVSLILVLAMLCLTSQEASTQECCIDTGGCAYEDVYQSCCIAPALALALVVIAAIIAVGVHNKASSSHSH